MRCACTPTTPKGLEHLPTPIRPTFSFCCCTLLAWSWSASFLLSSSTWRSRGKEVSRGLPLGVQANYGAFPDQFPIFLEKETQVLSLAPVGEGPAAQAGWQNLGEANQHTGATRATCPGSPPPPACRDRGLQLPRDSRESPLGS